MIAFRSTTFAAALILAAVPAFAQDSQDHAAHHPDATAAPQAQATSPSAPKAGMPGCDMGEQGASNSGGMMAGRDMMSMMKMMGSPGAAHIEGRLAFVKTELKIGDGQAAEWSAFADTVRANFKSMTDMRQSMMSGQ